MKRGIKTSWGTPVLGWRLQLAVFGAIAFWSSALAEGFRNPPPGTFNLGRAGGRIAQVDDSSAAVQNPANLVDLPAPELQFSPTVVYIKADYDSPFGQSAQSEDPWKFLPNGFVGVPLADRQFGVGLGVTTPYGLGSTWDQNSTAFQRPFGAWRYQTPYSTDLTTISIAPAVAARLGDYVQLGAALDVMWSDLTLKQYYPWFLVTGNLADPDGRIKAQGNGVGVGGKAGLTVELSQRQRLAFTYRLPMEVDYGGDLQVDNVPAALGGGTFRSDFRSSIKFPTIVAAGYGIDLTDKIRLEADVEWLQFSRFKELPIMLGTPLPGLPGGVNENWRDTFTIGFGGDWKFSEGWVLRAGYQFYQSPVPDSTFSPTIPDANQNVITVGLGYQFHHHSFEAAYGADFYDTRHIDNNQNPAFNGTFKFTVHLFSFAYRFSF